MVPEALSGWAWWVFLVVLYRELFFLWRPGVVDLLSYFQALIKIGLP